MDYPDENDLPDSAVKAMWDEGESVELAAGPERPVVQVAPSPWSWPIPDTRLTGWIVRSVVYLSYFGASTARYRGTFTDSGNNVTAALSG